MSTVEALADLVLHQNGCFYLAFGSAFIRSTLPGSRLSTPWSKAVVRRGVPKQNVEFKKADSMQVINMRTRLPASLSEMNAWFNGDKHVQLGLGCLIEAAPPEEGTTGGTKPQASKAGGAEDTVQTMRVIRPFSEWHQWLLCCFSADRALGLKAMTVRTVRKEVSSCCMLSPPRAHPSR